jgi:hypothetical protein
MNKLAGFAMVYAIVSIIVSIVVLSIGIGCLLLTSTPVKVDGATELRQADICVGDAIVINAKPDGKSVFDEGRGNVLKESDIYNSNLDGNMFTLYENVHWAVCYKSLYNVGFSQFVVYVWSD